MSFENFDAERITYCYTDASYNPQAGIAVCGYRLGTGGIIRVTVRNTQGVAEAEKLAIVDAIIAARGHGILGRLVVFTDHAGAEKMTQTEEWAQKYPDVELRFLKGHKKGTDRDAHHDQFREVDRTCRKILRKHMEDSEQPELSR